MLLLFSWAPLSQTPLPAPSLCHLPTTNLFSTSILSSFWEYSRNETTEYNLEIFSLSIRSLRSSQAVACYQQLILFFYCWGVLQCMDAPELVQLNAGQVGYRWHLGDKRHGPLAAWVDSGCRGWELFTHNVGGVSWRLELHPVFYYRTESHYERLYTDFAWTQSFTSLG